MYTIFINGKEVYTSLLQMEYFDIMEDLALEYYQTGTPHPDDITFTIHTQDTT